MPSGAIQDRRVMVERSDRMWSTGEGNGKPLQYSYLQNPMNSMKGQNDGIHHVQGERNPSKMVGVARGHQRADTLKP